MKNQNNIIMNKILPDLFTAAVLCLGAVSAHADDVTIKLVTSQSPGAKLTFALPLNTRVNVDWGDGETQTYRDSVVTGTLKGDTVTVKGPAQFSSFDCHAQKITWLDVTGASDLVSLDCSDNELKELNLMKNTALEELDCSKNQLATLGLTKAASLRSLDCSENKLTSLNIIPNNNLEVINASDNRISTLNVRPKTKLRSLWAANNKLTMLNFSNYATLQSLVCPGNEIGVLSIYTRAQVEDMWCQNNKITELNLSTSENLKTLDASNNLLDTLALSNTLNAKNQAQYINCSDNHLSFRSIYNKDIAKTYLCGTQTADIMPDTVPAAVYTDFSRYMTNASGRKNGILSFFNADDNSKLKYGSSAKLADYTMVSSVGRVKFFKNFDNLYLEITSNDYPDLKITTDNFKVYDEGIANGIEDINTANGEITAEVAENVLLLSSARQQKASVTSTDGVTVWNGTVGATPVEITLTPGVYVVGQKKIVVK